jgi:hypothetical protein
MSEEFDVELRALADISIASLERECAIRNGPQASVRGHYASNRSLRLAFPRLQGPDPRVNAWNQGLFLSSKENVDAETLACKRAYDFDLSIDLIDLFSTMRRHVHNHNTQSRLTARCPAS